MQFDATIIKFLTKNSLPFTVGFNFNILYHSWKLTVSFIKKEIELYLENLL